MKNDEQFTVNTAVIPVAGKGSRLYPLTKTTPKELLTTLDGSIIELIIQELVSSEITNIILVTSPKKAAIKAHVLAMELPLTPSGNKVSIRFIYQNKIPGNGGSILSAAPYTKSKPFLVVWGDELFLGGTIPRAKQLIKSYETHHHPVISLTEVGDSDVSKCGIVATKANIGENTYRITDLIEKPTLANTPSHFASVGGYIITPEIVAILKSTTYSEDGELYLSKALQAFAKENTLLGKLIDADWYETGSFAGYAQAFEAVAKNHKNEAL